MATSSSRDFVSTADEIITQALDLVNAANQGAQELAAAKAASRRTLNARVQSLSAKGIMSLWTREERTDLYVSDVLQNVVTSGTQEYDFGTDVIEVMADGVTIERSGNRQLMRPMGWREWMNEGDRDLAGKPNRFLIKGNQSYTGTNGRTIQGRLRLLLHPVPNNSTDVIRYVCTRKLQDFDAPGNDPDAPPVWMRCLVFALASDLAFKYGLDIQDRRDLRREFEKELDDMRRQDTPRGSMRLTPILPYGRPYGGRFY